MDAHITEQEVVEIARRARVSLLEGEAARLAEELDGIIEKLESLLAFEEPDAGERGAL